MTQRTQAAFELTITKLGAMGDGIGQRHGKPVYVPFTCEGDVAKVAVVKETSKEIRAKLLRLVEASPKRQPPACEHFGRCGGCSLQHLATPDYLAFKHNMLQQFVHNIKADSCRVAPAIEVGMHSRRRAEFAVQANGDELRIGFHESGSRKMFDLQQCPVSEAALTDILPTLRSCFASLKKPGRLLSVSVTALEKGLDVLIKISSPLGTADKERLVEALADTAIIRLSLQEQPRRESRRQAPPQDPVCLYDEGNAYIAFANMQVQLPAGAFLQATHAGQEAITQLVVEHLRGCDHIADLYSGCGTYSCALIEQASRVSAYEGADEMAAAMNNACVDAGLDERIETTVRDLFADPLSAQELSHFDGLVINPPRNGALPQVQEIAKSNIAKLVMVSCDPSTFKRDAMCLLEAGYKLTVMVPIDQFYWSRHLELVAVFEKIA